MKKSSLFAIALSFGLVGVVSCGGKEGGKATEDSAKADFVATEQVADPAAAQAEAEAQAAAAAEAAAAEKKAKEAAKYDPLLNKYKSKVHKCTSMAKKGMAIQDQECADVWMEAWELQHKLEKVKNKMTPEQQNEYKKLKREFRKFDSAQSE